MVTEPRFLTREVSNRNPYMNSKDFDIFRYLLSPREPAFHPDDPFALPSDGDQSTLPTYVTPSTEATDN